MHAVAAEKYESRGSGGDTAKGRKVVDSVLDRGINQVNMKNHQTVLYR